jgi:hypothetical protein
LISSDIYLSGWGNSLPAEHGQAESVTAPLRPG